MNEVTSAKTVLVSLIESIDMYNFLLRDHHRHTTVIAYHLAKHYGLSHEQQCRLMLAASIHDIGALHIKDRDHLLYVDAIDPEPHEKLGAKMLENFTPFKPISKIIRHHHIIYNDILRGKIRAEEVPLECYFLHLADRIDVLSTTYDKPEGKRAYIKETILSRFGNVFLPDLYDAFLELIDNDDFWDSIDDKSFHTLLFMSTESDCCSINETDIDELAEIFAKIVDFKSQWTSAHSVSVSILAENIAKYYGMSDDKCHMLKIAGYLHDIGKIAVPSELLDKPGALKDNEYKVMKSHAAYTSLILSKIPMLGDISRWAAAHHEKRDQSGYPMHLDDKSFTEEMDILAYADIFAALAEDRPYREALSKPSILKILKEFSKSKLSPKVYHVIEDNIDNLYLINLVEQVSARA